MTSNKNIQETISKANFTVVYYLDKLQRHVIPDFRYCSRDYLAYIFLVRRGEVHCPICEQAVGRLDIAAIGKVKSFIYHTRLRLEVFSTTEYRAHVSAVCSQVALTLYRHLEHEHRDFFNVMKKRTRVERHETFRREYVCRYNPQSIIVDGLPFAILHYTTCSILVS